MPSVSWPTTASLCNLKRYVLVTVPSSFETEVSFLFHSHPPTFPPSLPPSLPPSVQLPEVENVVSKATSLLMYSVPFGLQYHFKFLLSSITGSRELYHQYKVEMAD